MNVASIAQSYEAPLVEEVCLMEESFIAVSNLENPETGDFIEW